MMFPLQAFAWFSDLLVEHSELFWSLFAVDMNTVNIDNIYNIITTTITMITAGAGRAAPRHLGHLPALPDTQRLPPD